MPTTAPAVKLEGAKRLGAEVVLEGTTSLHRQRRAEAMAAERGLTIIPAFDHPDIIAGQGTVGLEILEQWPDVETIVVQIGGGGLIAGIAAWAKQNRPSVRIIGVEPRTADAMRRSVAAGEPVTIEPSSTIADGLMPVRPGDLTLAHVRAFVDDSSAWMTMPSCDATRHLMVHGKLVVEFQGAATVAALISGAVDLRGARTAAVLSGGNIDEPGSAAELLAQAAGMSGSLLRGVKLAPLCPPEARGRRKCSLPTFGSNGSGAAAPLRVALTTTMDPGRLARPSGRLPVHSYIHALEQVRPGARPDHAGPFAGSHRALLDVCAAWS
jgi:threonine dehydratase